MQFKILSAICFNLDQSKILSSGNGLTSTTQSEVLVTLRDRAFENIVGKGENAGNQDFFIFFYNVFISKTGAGAGSPFEI